MKQRRAAHDDREICFVGVMTGHVNGRVASQSEILADLFTREGYRAATVSRRHNRLAILIDIGIRLVTRRRHISVVWLGVYSGLSFVLEDFASLVAKWLHLPIIMHLHGGAMPQFIHRHPRWAHRVFSRATVLVAPSLYLARAVTEMGFDCSVIPNVVELAHYEYRERHTLQPNLFWMRSFHPIWNPALALRTLARLRDQYPDATLAMAGQDKGQLAETKALAAELGLSDVVSFVGFLDDAGKQREATKADIFLNTNRIDNTPVSIIEAAASGLVIVSTNVGGIPDLVEHERDALLVEDNDEVAMAGAVTRLLRDPVLGHHLSCNGRALAMRSDWRTVYPQWLDLLAKCTITSSAAPSLLPGNR